MNSDIFKNLMVFEMANNHQGCVEHGKNIISEISKITNAHEINGCIKFQYRDLPEFIHADFRERDDLPHIPRLMSTSLSPEQFLDMETFAKSKALKVMVTPFDEKSVERCIAHKVDIIKVASCSAADWPLLEAISNSGLPVIASTGGLSIRAIDKLVSFLSHKGVPFGIMHCVALYPTPPADLQLGMVARLKRRYHQVPVGYSGHEAPDDTDPCISAIALGAEMLERHVGLPTDEISLNKYSMSPEQADLWVKSAKKAVEMIGDPLTKALPTKEADSLLSLQRGVYSKAEVVKGKLLTKEDVFFAMPCAEGQLTSGEFGRYRAVYHASKEYGSGAAIHETAKEDQVTDIRSVVHQIKGMLYEARIHLGDEFSVEISHHFGMKQFHEIGCVIINVVNREYCKKLILVLPGQQHPLHRHEQKEETFQVLSGSLNVHLAGEQISLIAGDQLLVERGNWHSFGSKEGAIFEEISTTHIVGDSFYQDPEIAKLDTLQRKTIIDSETFKA